MQAEILFEKELFMQNRLNEWLAAAEQQGVEIKQIINLTTQADEAANSLSLLILYN